MIDNLCILFSTIMVLVVLFRAIKLDASEPWFKPLPRPDVDGDPARETSPSKPWRR